MIYIKRVVILERNGNVMPNERGKVHIYVGGVEIIDRDNVMENEEDFAKIISSSDEICNLHRTSLTLGHRAAYFDKPPRDWSETIGEPGNSLCPGRRELTARGIRPSHATTLGYCLTDGGTCA